LSVLFTRQSPAFLPITPHQ